MIELNDSQKLSWDKMPDAYQTRSRLGNSGSITR